MDTAGDRQTTPRWTADTELAFPLALRLTGSDTAACREIWRPYSSVMLQPRPEACANPA